MKAQNSLTTSDAFYLSVILAASILIMLPVVFCGVPSGSADFTHHLQISNAFFQSLENNIYYPDWVMNENLGYGAVTIRFYPPLIQYSLAVFRIFIGNWQGAIFTTFTLWSFVGGGGMYFWTKQLVANRARSAAAAILFILAPYHLNQFYNSFLFGEFAALSVLPFVFLFAYKVCHQGRVIDTVGFAAAFAALILTNLPQAVIGSICVGLYILLNADKSKLLKQLSLFSFSALAAQALSAFFWVRMFREMSWINVAQPNTDPDYDFRNHFLLADFSLDARGLWFATLILVIILSVMVIVVTASKSYKFLWRDKKMFDVGVLFVFSVIMTLPLSEFIWKNAEILQKVQFPWRFLSILTVCLPVLTAYCLQFINAQNWQKHRPAVLILTGVLLIYSFFSIKQIALGAAFTDGAELEKTVVNITRQKGLFHWLPIWANEKTFDEANPVSTENRRVEKTFENSERREFYVSEGEPARIRLPILYYPHWQAFVNAQPIAVEKSADGAIELNLPPEAAELKLIFVEPKESLAARGVSLLTLILLSALTVLWFCRLKFNNKNEIHY